MVLWHLNVQCGFQLLLELVTCWGMVVFPSLFFLNRCKMLSLHPLDLQHYLNVKEERFFKDLFMFCVSSSTGGCRLWFLKSVMNTPLMSTSTKNTPCESFSFLIWPTIRPMSKMINQYEAFNVLSSCQKQVFLLSVLCKFCCVAGGPKDQDL